MTSKKQLATVLYRRSSLRLKPPTSRLFVIPKSESDEESRFLPTPRRTQIPRFARDDNNGTDRLAVSGMTLSRLELHRHRLAVGSIHFKKLPRLEAEHTGQDISRERLNLGVQVAHHSVVITASVLNRVLSLT